MKSDTGHKTAGAGQAAQDTKHTPGSWCVTADGLIQNSDGRPIARLVSASLMAGSTIEREANARLIAAAPDLLAALQNSLKVIEALMPGVRYISVRDYAALNDVPIAACRAIAKAQSGSSEASGGMKKES